MTDNTAYALPQSFSVTPLHPRFGARIGGIDLRFAPDPLEAKSIRSLLVKHKVLIFENQDVDDEQLLAFAQAFGTPDTYPVGKDKHSPVLAIHSGPEQQITSTNHWHSDTSGWEKPCFAVLLHAREVPEVGGDTLFADMVLAYAGLPEQIKTRIAFLSAIHDESGLSQYVSDGARRMLARTYPPVEHPVVRTHPESGEKILYVNSLLTAAIKGLEPEEGKTLLEFLCAQASVPEYQLRHRWRKNEVAFWDNRSTQHYASNDYWPAVRKMNRISIGGDRPF